LNHWLFALKFELMCLHLRHFVVVGIGSVGDLDFFKNMEALGMHAVSLYDKQDAGLWEFRGIARVHTFSAMMCWVACDRLAFIAKVLHLSDRVEFWTDHAGAVRL
jgi:GH15 family glucan-1,4-alpha-glucosidase